MTWQEFLLRSEAHRRNNKDSKLDIQYLAYHSLIAPHVSHKTLPKSFAKFTGSKEEAKVSDKAKEFYLSEMNKFKELQKNGKS